MIARTKSFKDEMDSFLLKVANYQIAAVKKHKSRVFKYSCEDILVRLSVAAMLQDTVLFDALIAGDQHNLLAHGLLDSAVDGKALALHDCGEVAMEGVYLNGQRFDTFHFFYSSGQLRALIEYRNGEVARLIEYDPDGTITESVMFDENGKSCGNVFSIVNSQVPKPEVYSVNVTHVNGLMEGPYLSVYQNAKQNKRVECHYLKGKKHGEYREWYPNGVVKTIANYKNGRLDGKRTCFELNTRELVVSNHKAGLRHGEYIHYSPDMKTIKFQGNYSNGLLNGEIKTWYYPNNTLCTILFENGVPQLSQ